VSVEHFRRRADECRRLAFDAGNARDKAFWLGLVARWQALGACPSIRRILLASEGRIRFCLGA